MPAVIGRFYNEAEEKEKQAESRGALDRFLDGAIQVCDENKIYVAVRVEKDKADTVGYLRSLGEGRIVALPITSWGEFAIPLNAALFQAARDGARQVLIQSTELVPTLDEFGTLKYYLTEVDALMVGARLVGHEFYPGQHVEARGVTIPWNTAALWDLAKLSLTGFPLVGDGPLPDSQKGVEELPTIGLLKMLLPRQSAVRLINIPDFGDLYTKHWDEKQRKNHEKKMATKNPRAEEHMWRLGLEPFTVEHVGA